MIPRGEFYIFTIDLEYLVTRFQLIDTGASTGHESGKLEDGKKFYQFSLHLGD